MRVDNDEPKPACERGIAKELEAMEWEPLLPVEKKLIGWSLGLGTALLFILYYVSNIFFPGAHG